MDPLTKHRIIKFGKDSGFTGELPILFEKYVAYNYLRKYLPNAYQSVDDVVIQQPDGGIDIAAVIVNEDVVTDREELEAAIRDRQSNSIKVVFIQAKTSSNYDVKLLARFLHGVESVTRAACELLNDNPIDGLESGLHETANILFAAIINIDKFRDKNIPVELYYVTTAQHQDENVQKDQQIINAITRIKNLQVYQEDLTCSLHGESQLYNKAREFLGPQNVQFTFSTQQSIPFDEHTRNENVSQAYIGIIPLSELMKVLTSEQEMREKIFTDNVRLNLGNDNDVNAAIYGTLTSNRTSMFPLLNNGVTLITRKIDRIANAFTISDYQVVNGCQTCHQLVRFAKDVWQSNDSEKTLDNIFVPLKLICTNNSKTTAEITVATNWQSPITDADIQGSSEQAKRVEEYFQQSGPSGLRYSRQSSGDKQTDNEVAGVRNFNTDQINRAFAACIFGESSKSIGSPNQLRNRASKIWQNFDVSLYYFASWITYKVEAKFRQQKTSVKGITAAKYHICMLTAVQFYPNLKACYAQDDARPQTYSSLAKKLSKTKWDDVHTANHLDSLIETSIKVVREHFAEKLRSKNLIKDDVRALSVQKELLDRLLKTF
ncbi:hypothetical protein FRX94_01000 [Corynebacterium canis]|uniref:Abortive phage infection protein C-terminal domain-containing protein n=1 Tax=Corynebacterium canis TaxID=679663 RepID=A0A5C5UQP3_9CORY|nr:AIPR family protein [Corynebacterium canis]TWT28801.1 hypothetical protein FRX94_01000 [Corynebacterium canis]WJY74928.1 AIPR protein [Corynebacterium canis]